VAVRYIDVQKMNNQIHLVREIDLKDGTVGTQIHVLPVVSFSIRAGEYGLDPVADADAVWDILLNENHIDDPEETALSPLVTEDTLEAARDLHLKRCRYHRDRLDKRLRVKGETTGSEDEVHQACLKKMRDLMPANQDLIEVVREHTKDAMLRHKARLAEQVEIDPIAHLTAQLQRKLGRTSPGSEHNQLPGSESDATRSGTSSPTADR
jgi:hypothetical protein